MDPGKTGTGTKIFDRESRGAGIPGIPSRYLESQFDNRKYGSWLPTSLSINQNDVLARPFAKSKSRSK